MISKELINSTNDLLLHQLKNWWTDVNEVAVKKAAADALEIMEENFSVLSNKRLYNDSKMNFSPHHSVTWAIFLYRVSHILSANGYGREADMVYYLNKIMNSVDWFHQIELPVHFMAEHPLSCVLGRAVYGDHFFVYQGTTVGGNRHNGELKYPTIGNNVILYANSTVLGDTHIGNNVMISAGSYIINETIPDNCIVFGSSPNLVIKQRTEQEIKEKLSCIWSDLK